MNKTIIATVLCLLIGNTPYAQSTIKGEVTDTAGKPIANLQLLLKQNNRVVNGAYTNALGVYQICEIEEGTYDISAGGTFVCLKLHTEKDISISGSEVKFINFTINCLDVEMHNPEIIYGSPPPSYHIENEIVEQYIGFNEAEADQIILNLYNNSSFKMDLIAEGNFKNEPQETLIGAWIKDENQLKLVTNDNEIIYRQVFEDMTIAGKSFKLETYVFETCKKDFFASNFDLVKDRNFENDK